MLTLQICVLTAALSGDCEQCRTPVATLAKAPLEFILEKKPARKALAALTKPGWPLAEAILERRPVRRLVGNLRDRRPVRRVLFGR